MAFDETFIQNALNNYNILENSVKQASVVFSLLKRERQLFPHDNQLLMLKGHFRL
jgi:hypothetical protein